MVKLFFWQTVASLFTTTSIVAMNLHYGWASKAAVIPSGYLLLSYNVVDTAVGGAYYITFDRTMLVHHIASIAAIGVLLQSVIGGGYTVDLQRFVQWVLLAEVTTFFNSIRLLTRKTCCRRITEQLFGAVFIAGRSAMTIGCTQALYNNALFTTLAPITFVTGAFNLHWCVQIIRLAGGLDPRAHSGFFVYCSTACLALVIALLHRFSTFDVVTAA